MNEIRLENWRQFLLIADHLDVGSALGQAYAFRGHSNSAWSLRPSLLRLLLRSAATVEQALEVEEHALAEFRSQAHHHVPANVFSTTRDTVSWWTLMQDHGAPTRVLDWSASIYVAAYFAVSEDFDSDGAIWIVHRHSLYEQMAERDDYTEFPETMGGIKSTFLQANAPKVLMFAGRISKSNRMIAQQGYFSICPNILGDHGQILADSLGEPSAKSLFSKLIVPAKLKISFMKKLRSMNITANSLFPGLDGLGRSVAELVRLGFE